MDASPSAKKAAMSSSSSSTSSNSGTFSAPAIAAAATTSSDANMGQSADHSMQAMNNSRNNNNTSNDTDASNNNDHDRSDPVAGRPAPHRVRLFFLSGAWSRVSRADRVLVLANLTITIAQLVSIITVLVVSRNQGCDKPLDVFLIVYLLRSVANTPLVVYHYLRPGNNLQQQQSSYANATTAATATTTTANTESTSTAGDGVVYLARPPPPPAPPTTNTNAATVDTVMPARRNWTDRLRSLLDIFGIVWFIIGNYFLFTSGQCIQGAPSLFYTTLVWILLGYLLVLIPLFLCISVIFCLPCVLVLMRALRLGYASGLVTGASKEEIDNVPVYKYKSNEPQEEVSSSITNSCDNTSRSSSFSSPRQQQQQQEQQQKQQRKKRRSIFRWFFMRRPKQQADTERNYDPITITPAEDAVCSICLSEYEQDDLVCKLWCGHHFHKDCVHEWLALNSSCPLCKRDFRTKADS
ncbi:hypothetical protein BDB00DRAFT_318509 [Zychaea mexicana]|uniref:uncharacterized protein n=1 Tax=Zychaea mexicana TaxID=64656 RepID=UPI0022FEF7EF|nr:uncharacterized protein BDB00DRAFT_318509 [Zychaea mexicana]KAI9494261.1 hypothetical protein BDB00DRAFT_318509 [Zychaea mexicana]